MRVPRRLDCKSAVGCCCHHSATSPPTACRHSSLDVARLATSLPSLRHLRLVDWPPMDQQALEHILLHSPSLQLLQTAWRPAPAPGIPPGAELDARQRQELQRHEQGHEFCRAWRFKLQHRQAVRARPVGFWEGCWDAMLLQLTCCR